MFKGKKTRRVRVPQQMRFDPAMFERIEKDAENNDRSPSEQIIYYVKRGIFHDEECEVKARGVTRSHSLAQRKKSA